MGQNDSGDTRVGQVAAGASTGWRRLALTGRLTLREAEERRAEFLSVLAGADPIELDCSGLDVVDAAGLQLLIALRHSAERAGKAVRLARSPEGALRAALVTAGFVEGGSGKAIVSHDRFWRGEG